MTNTMFRRAAAASALATAACGALAAAVGPLTVAAGVLAGGVWHMASLGCLARMLAAWLGPRPSQRRAIGWLLLKLSLYAGAFALIRLPSVSALGFGLGFTAVLVSVLCALAVSSRRLASAR